KKSFRRLAMLYHPDKHNEDKIASAQYREIQEAYDTLTDPYKKEAYLQQRWYEQSMGRKLKGSAPLTSSAILRDALSLEKYISTLDPFRIDKDGLIEYIQALLSDDAIEILLSENEQGIISNITVILLQSGKVFTLAQAERLALLLHKIGKKNSNESIAIQQYLSSKTKEANRDRWKIPVILIVTVLLCLLIYLSGK
ncbi:MAG: J domain-containing protein, partial [Chitinophagaceae bacterium]